MITFTAGDTEFQKTLTKREKEYIHQGCNWLGKWEREINIKSLRLVGYTLDEVERLPEDEQKKIFQDAETAWNEIDR